MQVGIFSDAHRMEMSGFFFGQDNTRVEVLTYWFEQGADAIQAASDLRAANPGAFVKASKREASWIAPYRVVMHRKLA